jgi:arylsulfatase A-like enzyme
MKEANSITRRSALGRIAGAAAGTMAAAAFAPRANAAARPNLLFILSDDQHFRALGAAGNPDIRTPVQDRLAAEGTHFTHCHVSNPICTPSRAAIQTGQYGFRNGVTFFGHAMNEDSPRIARLLSEAGYSTGYTGKWHNDQRPVHHGFQQMRNVFLGGMHTYDSIPVVQGADDEKVNVPRQPTELFTDAALELLDTLPEPFCLFVCYTAPHDPRTPPPEYEAMYPPDSVSLPPNFLPAPPFDTGTLDIRDEKLMPRPLDPHELKAEIGRYYGLITHMDDQIGRIVSKLESSGKWDNTLTIFAGDNGLAVGSHGLLGKQTLHEEGIRAPLIVCGPGVQAGQRCDALVDLMDVMPTLCDAGTVAIPETVDGRSLLPHCTGKKADERDAIFCHYEDMFRMVRTRRFKLIDYLKLGCEELFDLETDPYEVRNLAESPQYQDTLKSLREQLKTWRAEMGDA